MIRFSLPSLLAGSSSARRTLIAGALLGVSFAPAAAPRSSHVGVGEAIKSSLKIKALMNAAPFSVSPGELLKAAAEVPANPKFSVVELIEENTVKVDDAGRAASSYRYIFRVDHESAIQGWGVIQAGWLPWLSDRPIIRARVITSDGSEHILDPSTVGEVQPDSGTPEMFEDNRMLRGPLPKLQVGAVVEVEVQTRDHRAFSRSGLRRNIPLHSNVPIHLARTNVELPVSSPLKWSLLGLPKEVLQRKTLGNRVSLQIEQSLVQPPKAMEPNQAWDQEPWPILTITTAPSWEAVAAEYRGILDTQLQGIDLKEWVADAIGDAKERTLVIRRILARLHSQVRYIGLEFGEAAIVPRTPAETLRRGYGDCKDKATLLVGLLKSAGIVAHVALLRVGPGRDFNPDLPGLAAFNHAIVFVPGEHPLWIDPSVSQAGLEALPLPDYGRRALVVAEGTKAPVLIPEVEIERNLQIETREVFLAERGPGRVVETTVGVGAREVALRADFTGTDSLRLKENLKKYVKDAYKAESLEHVEFSDPLNLQVPFHLKLEAEKVGTAFTSSSDARVVMNPWPLVSALNQSLQPAEPEPTEGNSTNKVNNASQPRRTDLQFAHAWATELKWIIHVPTGFESEALPESKALSFGPAKLSMNWKARPDGNVEAIYRFTCPQVRWTPAEVEAARTALKTFGEEASPVVVFQQVGEAHLSAGRLKEALAAFRSLVTAHPTAAGPLVRLGRAQLQAGLGDSARKSLRRAVELEPTSEEAHRQLGWTLEHDAVGRRFSPGWDRGGAVAALRRAVELAPDLRMARLDLAILLEHDLRGERYASGDLEESIKLYREQISKGKDSGAQSKLTQCLARVGRFAEAHTSAQAMDPGDDRNGWTLALGSCIKGIEAAIQEARRSHQDPEVRRKAFQEASNLLMDLRRYPEAGAMAKEGVGGSGEAAKLKARALLCSRLKRYETVAIDTKTPAGAVLAFAKAAIDKQSAPERIYDLLSPAQRPERPNGVEARKLMESFIYFKPWSGDWRNRRMDEGFSVEELGQEGSETTGYRLQSTQAGPFPITLFVSSSKGVCRMVTWGNRPTPLGREALWEAERGNLAGAIAWLDRAADLLTLPTPQNPFKGHPAAHFWAKGRKGTIEEVRLAASILVLMEETHETSMKLLERNLPSITEPAQRSAALRCLLARYSKAANKDRWDELTGELLRLYPDQPMAILYRVEFLAKAKRVEEAIAMAESARIAHPDAGEILAMEAFVLGRQGRFEESASILKTLTRKGKAQASNLNSLAWADVCAGSVTERTAEWAEQAIQQRKSPDLLHTQACVLIDLGRTAEAREALATALNDDAAPRPVDWYAFGRMAEELGEPATAREWYSRVEGPGENSEDPEDPTSCIFLARRRLAAISGKGISTSARK